MLPGRTIFAEPMSHVSPREFQTRVDRYDGDYKASRFSCWDQYLCRAFAQLTCRESLRDIEACLRALQPKLYHVGIRTRVARSTLADANETRDWRIYRTTSRCLRLRSRISTRRAGKWSSSSNGSNSTYESKRSAAGRAAQKVDQSPLGK
jgi:hypothetical protein